MSRQLLNEVVCSFSAISENESFARGIAASFIAQGQLTVTQLADVKCAVSEAVTNCIVHAYPVDFKGTKTVKMTLRRYDGNFVIITIADKGIGIADVAAAREPLFTTDTTGERSGMGFAIMESLMDSIKVRSVVGKGTTVTLNIKLGAAPAEPEFVHIK